VVMSSVTVVAKVLLAVLAVVGAVAHRPVRAATYVTSSAASYVLFGNATIIFVTTRTSASTCPSTCTGVRGRPLPSRSDWVGGRTRFPAAHARPARTLPAGRMVLHHGTGRLFQRGAAVLSPPDTIIRRVVAISLGYSPIDVALAPHPAPPAVATTRTG
jgi:hypothetical protein